MATIPLHLPDDLQRFVQQKVQSGEFASAAEYIVALVDAARHTRSEIERALLEGLQSGPAQEWTSDEWATIERRVLARRQVEQKASRRIVRRLRAAQDVEEIADYIARENIDAAIRFLKNAEHTLRDLAPTPDLGNRFHSDVPDLSGVRYWRVTGFPRHLIFYLTHTDAIEVLRVLHAARDWPAELEGSS